MFDLHFLHAVKNGVRYYSADRFMFDPLFPHVSDTMKTRMFQWLQDNTIHFDSSYKGSVVEGLPLVALELNEQFYEHQGLGNQAFPEVDADGRVFQRHHLFTSQEVRANIFAKEMEVVRLIHRIIQGSMLLFHKSFINAGYQNILFTGTTSLEPELALEGESLNVYARQVKYSALNLMEIPAYVEDLDNIGIYDPLYDIQVQLTETTPEESGVAGGIVVLSEPDS